jgi:hypothetical protein
MRPPGKRNVSRMEPLRDCLRDCRRAPIKGQETVAETRHELPTQIAAWKRDAVEKVAKVFDEKGSARFP